jgi:hypothetical protein
VKVTSLSVTGAKRINHYSVLGSFVLQSAAGPLRAALLERGGRRWVSFPPAGPGRYPTCEIDASDIGPAFARDVLALAEKELGLIALPAA